MPGLAKEYLVCKECLPLFHSILEDMTSFISQEVGSLKQSQMRKEVLKFVHAKKIEMREQYRVLREFIGKVSGDLERGDFEFIRAYMSDFMITIRSNDYQTSADQTGTSDPEEQNLLELETNLLTHYRLMRGIVGLKSPMELDFEGISEIKKCGEDERDIHDFPLTTRFINLEMTRSRAGTQDVRSRRGTGRSKPDLENSHLSLEKKNEELRRLFQEKDGGLKDIQVPEIESLDAPETPTTISAKVG